MQIYVPTKGPKDWKQLLAQPELHWKAGHSAMALAQSWETHKEDGCPPEVRKLLGSSCVPLLAIPEYRVPLPGGDRPSQSDVLVLLREPNGLSVMLVEGKVNETFGPTLEERRVNSSSGVEKRIQYLLTTLELPSSIPGSIRYQLLHRAASAILVARDFCAWSALVLVHSFSDKDAGYKDFEAFIELFVTEPIRGWDIDVGMRSGISLSFAWCPGNPRFLNELAS